MLTPRIQSDERGITLNKSLAWTIVVAMILGGMWVGARDADTKARLITLETMTRDRAAQISNLDGRIRPLENQSEVVRSQLIEIGRGIERIEQQLNDAKKAAATP